MTITCSNCDKPFDITTDDHLVACPWCGQATFSPGADDGPDEDELHAAGWRAGTEASHAS